MVSFVCDTCQETVKKPKLDQHYGRCRRAAFSCIDCSRSFKGNEAREHVACISEAQKHQKSLYRPPKTNKTSVSIPVSNPSPPPPLSLVHDNAFLAPLEAFMKEHQYKTLSYYELKKWIKKHRRDVGSGTEMREWKKMMKQLEQKIVFMTSPIRIELKKE